METVVRSGVFNPEGDIANVLPSQSPHTISLYRLYLPSAMDHFYTPSETERDNAINDGYTYEGVAAYVFLENVSGTVPLYRMYNPTTNDHFCTTNAVEKENVIIAVGYGDEGIAAYVNP